MDEIVKNIREGTHVLLPFYETLPELNLSLGKAHYLVWNMELITFFRFLELMI